jgi:hypothetical protein
MHDESGMMKKELFKMNVRAFICAAFILPVGSCGVVVYSTVQFQSETLRRAPKRSRLSQLKFKLFHRSYTLKLCFIWPTRSARRTPQASAT